MSLIGWLLFFVYCWLVVECLLFLLGVGWRLLLLGLSCVALWDVGIICWLPSLLCDVVCVMLFVYCGRVCVLASLLIVV